MRNVCDEMERSRRGSRAVSDYRFAHDQAERERGEGRQNAFERAWRLRRDAVRDMGSDAHE